MMKEKWQKYGKKRSKNGKIGNKMESLKAKKNKLVKYAVLRWRREKF